MMMKQRSDLVDAVHARLKGRKGFTKPVVKTVTVEVFEALAELLETDPVMVMGFGSFRPRIRAGYTMAGFDGNDRIVPTRRVLSFKAGKALKARVNNI